jgi:hypothetical protein
MGLPSIPTTFEFSTSCHFVCTMRWNLEIAEYVLNHVKLIRLVSRPLHPNLTQVVCQDRIAYVVR